METETEKLANPEETQISEHSKQLNYLLSKVNTEIALFTKSTESLFKVVKRFQYLTVIISAAITIILGLNLGWVENVDSRLAIAESPLLAKDVALVLGAVLTLLGTLRIFWNVDNYWLQNKVTKQQLKLLRNEINYLKSRKNQATQEELDNLFNRFQNIMRQFHLYWEGVLQDINRKGKNEERPTDNNKQPTPS